MMESLRSGVRWSERGNSSTSSRPDGIIRSNDAVYKLREPTEPLEVEIVFLHGLQFSDYEEAYWKSWMGGEKGSEVCWPMTWLSEDLPGARIWSLFYDSCAWTTGRTGRMDLYSLGESLVQSMVGLANIGQENCPVVFVCHCLGGLVAKEIVIKAHGKFGKEPKYAEFLNNIRGFFFYGTPHDGSRLADFAFYVPWKSKMVELLGVINDELGRCNADFRRIANDHFANRWQFSVVAETHKTTFYACSVMVVEESSARHGYDSFLPVAADHFEVCKPTSKVDSSYLVLRNFVKDLVLEDRVRKDDILKLPSFVVGMEERLDKARGRMDVHSKVGMVGMGGIGKTTLSKELYNREKQYYEKSCFLEDVKSAVVKPNGIEVFQRKLFSSLCGTWDENASMAFHLEHIKQCIMTKKVLLVVDDVGSEANLKALQVDAFDGEDKGSKLIVTTRREDILLGHLNREGIVDLDFLSENQALELFLHYAFFELDMIWREELHGISKDISKACAGLPLSLEVIGQYLRNYNDPSYDDERMGLWKAALGNLQKARSLDGSREDRLWATLRISYSDLDEEHQSIFLDFACIISKLSVCYFSNYWETVSYKEAVGLFGRIWNPSGVRNLINRSLIKWSVGRKTFFMHDQLRDMGQSIGHTSRLWVNCDGLQYVSVKPLEGLVLFTVLDDDLQKACKVRKTNMGEAERLELLRMLCFESCPLHVVEYFISLCSVELRWLRLNGIYISSTSIQGLGLFRKLRVLELLDCSYLKHLPECIGELFSLMELVIRDCDHLESLPASIGGLSDLTVLDLTECAALKSLPDSIGELKSLQSLLVRFCEVLESLPDSIGGLTSLKTLDVRGCWVLRGIPAGVGKLRNLECVDASNCPLLETLCEFGTGMHRLNQLVLYGCFILKTIKSLGNLTGLKRLHLWGCEAVRIENLCDHLGQLSKLQELNLDECSGLAEAVLESLQKGKFCTDDLEILNLPVFPGESGLPPCPRLRHLYLDNCLREKQFFESTGYLSQLTELYLCDNYDRPCVKILPDALFQLERLQVLVLESFGQLERLPENIRHLSSLARLRIKKCSGLVELPSSLGELSSLRTLELDECGSLEFLPSSLGNLRKLESLSLQMCDKLQLNLASQFSILRLLKSRGCRGIQLPSGRSFDG